MPILPATNLQRFSSLLLIEFMFKEEKVMLPAFFDFKLLKWDPRLFSIKFACSVMWVIVYHDILWCMYVSPMEQFYELS